MIGATVQDQACLGGSVGWVTVRTDR